jgi:hypothetical protein
MFNKSGLEIMMARQYMAMKIGLHAGLKSSDEELEYGSPARSTPTRRMSICSSPSSRCFDGTFLHGSFRDIKKPPEK